LKTKIVSLVITLLLGSIIAQDVVAQSSQSMIDPATFRGPAADQRAYRVGDVLTVYVLEATRARSQAGTDAENSAGFAADFTTSAGHYNGNGSVGLQGKTKGAAQTTRVGELRAQISVRVDSIESNGLMRIKGTQLLEVNKEQQKITLTGLVRPEDISSGNIIWSNRIADAQVSLAGKGIVSESQRKGLIAKIVTWLRIL
jgi:flagellar L-ring protein FlgH